jgi:replicative DNA helicase
MVYQTVYDYMNKNTTSDVPKPAQIFEMVALLDKDKKISKQSFKLLITTNLNEYDEESFIKPKLKAWILKERIKISSDFVVDKTRELENSELDLNIMEEFAGYIRETVNANTISNFGDEDDLGSDFDDAEKHVQDNGGIRVKTGWSSLDAMLAGGMSDSTLNILMGQTSVGKSLWLQNIGANVANQGYNVVYFTLEMSEAKVLKRLGAMRLKIPINDYDEKSKNTEYIKERIDNLNNGGNILGDPGGLFENKIGKVNVKFFAAGTANITHLESHLKSLEQKKGFKPDLILVDYITLMSPVKGLNVESNLYMKGKHLAEALRALAAQWECPLVTAIQVAKDAWNAADVTLDKVPESKAIAETADTFAAIIRTEEMKRNNRYIIKLLKQRDGDFSNSKAQFDLNPKYLTIENDQLIDDIT